MTQSCLEAVFEAEVVPKTAVESQAEAHFEADIVLEAEAESKAEQECSGQR